MQKGSVTFCSPPAKFKFRNWFQSNWCLSTVQRKKQFSLSNGENWHDLCANANLWPMHVRLCRLKMLSSEFATTKATAITSTINIWNTLLFNVCSSCCPPFFLFYFASNQLLLTFFFSSTSDMKIIKRFWPFLSFISNLFQNLRDEFPINSALHIFTFRLANFYC